eukprot:TRINITY_DN267_c0_g1_i1.p1 TRINITY_DN267_c0_g1~~TRINITY_DN267_c0_g1_i1.p1  ORF type:complete len:220 (+),score=34.20 TRINITY_DN267_c0_g1_i1:165-824(+)
MPHGNYEIVSNHFSKDWQDRVKTWFNQPAKKIRRRQKRAQKAAKAFPRPTQRLRPTVHPPTIKHNRRLRIGRGFTMEELKAAKLPVKYARTIGISVDHRRFNHSEESLHRNVTRLRRYLGKLILFPHNSRAISKKYVKSGKSGLPSRGAIKQVVRQYREEILPVAQQITDPKVVKLADYKQKGSVYSKLRSLRIEARLLSKKKKAQQEKRAKLAEEANK